MAERARTRGRGGFAPVVLAGLASAGAATLVSTRPWFDADSGLVQPSMPGIAVPGVEPTSPAATGVALVLLAAWGVLLVTRGRVRRAFAVVAVLAALGLVAAAVTAGLAPPEAARPLRGDPTPPEVSLTAWYWLGAVLSVLSVVPAVLAVRWCPRWPEMGSRYDAPADAASRRASSSEGGDSERELWRSLDEGHDPTDPTDPTDPRGDRGAP